MGIRESTMSNLSAFLKRETGLVYPRERWGELERRMASAAREFGFDDTESCVRWLMSGRLSRSQVETLAGFLTVGETYFYRDPRMLEIAEREILPSIVKSRRGRDQRLRIWSAGCSTGEEPYSIAILLHRLLPDLAEWKITILATDINSAALQKGMAGVYGAWSFRGTPDWFKDIYFSAEPEERFRVAERVRRMVSFEYLNLAEDSYPSLPTNTNAMDVIFCRNVLMYFEPETVQSVVGKLRRSLVDGGWLVVGPAETAPRGYTGLETVSIAGVTCYRKSDKAGGVGERLQGEPVHAGSNSAPEPVAPRQSAWPLTATTEDAGALAESRRGGGESGLSDLHGVPPQTVSARAEVGSLPEARERGQARGERDSGQSDTSRAETEGASRAVPAGEESALAAAEDLYRQGLYREAAAQLTPLLEGEPAVEALTLLIRCEANQGRLDEALEACDRALEVNKLDPTLHYLRAEILQEQGANAEAQLALQRALYLDPDMVLAHVALGNLSLWSGKGERAQRHFQSALTLLESFAPDHVLPGSDGMSAGRLREIIRSMRDGFRQAGGGGR